MFKGDAYEIIVYVFKVWLQQKYNFSIVKLWEQMALISYIVRGIRGLCDVLLNYLRFVMCCTR